MSLHGCHGAKFECPECGNKAAVAAVENVSIVLYCSECRDGPRLVKV